MVKAWLKLGIGSVFLVLVLAIAACSAVPAPLQTAFATATPAPTETPTPAPAATTQKNAGNQSQQNPANLPGEFRNLGLEGGVVTGNTGSLLGLRLGKSEKQLQVAPTAIVIIPGVANAMPSDIQVGDRIIAKVPESDTAAIATLLLDFPKGYTSDNVVFGLVQSNANGTLQVRARKGNEQITTDSSTFVGLVQDKPKMGTASDIKRGNAVLVIGKPDGNSLSAQVIVVVDRAALQARRNRNTPSATPTP